MLAQLSDGVAHHVSNTITLHGRVFGYDADEDGCTWVGPRPVCHACGETAELELSLDARWHDDVTVRCDSCDVAWGKL